ncbi:MAG: leucine-rich repeat domain-containing protein [Promethearchaeota archaeon]
MNSDSEFTFPFQFQRKLSNNQIKEMENIEKLKNLKFIDLSNNKIEKIDNLSELTNIKTLKLNGNPIAKSL